MGFTRAQVEQLLQPINPRRVLKDGKGNSHVSQQDVTAHMVRIFGFGSFDVEIEGPELVFEQPRVNDQGKQTGRWDVCYRAKATLTVRDPDGNVVCRLQGSATDTAENQKRGDAHDLALKSAESTAKKRAATNLGDQFGLSLYNKGQLTALVRGTLVVPEGEAAEGDVQEGVEQQVSLGHDEVDRTPDASAGEVSTDHSWLARMEAGIGAASTADELAKVGAEIEREVRSGRVSQVHNEHLYSLFQQRQGELNGQVAA